MNPPSAVPSTPTHRRPVVPDDPGELDLRLDTGRVGALRASLKNELREEIRLGRLRPGSRLPSTRTLAADLGISRNTVAEAYSELLAEGWLTARRGSGTRVSCRPDQTGHANVTPSRLEAPQPEVVDLRPGAGDASGFPGQSWVDAAGRALACAGDAYSSVDPRGRIELRRVLADRLGRVRGVCADPSRIVVRSGPAAVLRLLSRALPPGAVAVEAYGDPAHRDAIGAHGHGTVVLPVDDDGVVPDRLGDREVSAALLTPAHQFPRGGPLSSDRRAQVLDWARSSGGIVVEHDRDGQFRHDRQRIGPLQAVTPEHVVYLGTLGGSLAPMLRMAWTVVPERLLPAVLDGDHEQEARASVLDELTLAELITSGDYHRHVRTLRMRYRRRRDQIVEVLARRAPSVEVAGVGAGHRAVLLLPPGTEQAVVDTGAAQGVLVTGLSAYRHPQDPREPVEGVVVDFGAPSDDRYPSALAALCRLLRRTAR